MDETFRTSIWRALDIAPTTDRAEIKRAYAAKLKTLDRERDVDGFQALREAYEQVLRLSENDRTYGSSVAAASEESATNERASNAVLVSNSTEKAASPPELNDDSRVSVVVDRLLELMSDDAASAHELMLEVEGNEHLQSLAVCDNVSMALIEAMYPEDFHIHKLHVLAQRFGWLDGFAQTGSIPQSLVYAWIRRPQLIHHLDNDPAIPVQTKAAWRRLKRDLSGSLDWKHAFRWAFVPMAEVDLVSAYKHLDAYLRGDVDVVLTLRQKDFLLELCEKRPLSLVGWSTLVARASFYGSGVSLLSILGALHLGEPVTKSLLEWPVQIGVVAGLILFRRIVQWVVDALTGRGPLVLGVLLGILFVFKILPDLVQRYAGDGG